MGVSVRDCRHSADDRRWIQDVYGEYLESLSDLNTGFFPVIDNDDPQKDGIFASWFANERSHPLIIANGADRVGFALVTRPQMPVEGEWQPDFRMAEFFIRKGCRRNGYGRDAASLIFDRFAGEWMIVAYQRNSGSVGFWRQVLTAYCRGALTERARNGEVQHRFRSRHKTAF